MNAYQRRLKELEDAKCPSCEGSGEQDDADLGDISFRRWKCTTCNGTGLKPGTKHGGANK